MKVQVIHLSDPSVLPTPPPGGLACAVDPATGCLRHAARLQLGSPHFEFDPESGKPLVGRRLPLWREAVELAIRAHRSIPERLVVGWDIGLTREGAVLVEGNGSPCVVMAQKLSDEPLGSGRFGELLLFHFEGVALS